MHVGFNFTRARFLSLTWSKLRLCSANHRAGYFSNLACAWLSIVWAYSKQETENGPRRPSHLRYFDRIRNSTKIWSALVSNTLSQSQRNFAHVTTVTLSWRVQHFVVIGKVYFKPGHFKFWSNFQFDRNIISGTGARSSTVNSQYLEI